MKSTYPISRSQSEGLFRPYADIDELLETQPEHILNMIYQVDDASLDGKLEFPSNAINRRAFYRYEGGDPGLGSYVLISAPYATSSEGTLPELEEGTLPELEDGNEEETRIWAPKTIKEYVDIRMIPIVINEHEDFDLTIDHLNAIISIDDTTVTIKASLLGDKFTASFRNLSQVKESYLDCPLAAGFEYQLNDNPITSSANLIIPVGRTFTVTKFPGIKVIYIDGDI